MKSQDQLLQEFTQALEQFLQIAQQTYGFQQLQLQSLRGVGPKIKAVITGEFPQHQMDREQLRNCLQELGLPCQEEDPLLEPFFFNDSLPVQLVDIDTHQKPFIVEHLESKERYRLSTKQVLRCFPHLKS